MNLSGVFGSDGERGTKLMPRLRIFSFAYGSVRGQASWKGEINLFMRVDMVNRFMAEAIEEAKRHIWRMRFLLVR